MPSTDSYQARRLVSKPGLDPIAKLRQQLTAAPALPPHSALPSLLGTSSRPSVTGSVTHLSWTPAASLYDTASLADSQWSSHDGGGDWESIAGGAGEDEALAQARRTGRSERALKRALDKIRQGAAFFDKERSGCTKLFSDAKSMDAKCLKETLANTFNIRLRRREIAALIAYIDKDGDGTVDTSEFQLAFLRLQHEGRKQFDAEKDRRHARVTAKHKRVRDAQERRHVDAARAAVEPYTAEVRQKVLARMATVAKGYDPTRVQGFAAFEGEMSPTAFKEQLRRNFGLRLNGAELGALMDYFDRDKSGTVEGAEFLIEFNRLYKVGKMKLMAEREAATRKLDERMERLEKEALKRFKQETVAVVAAFSAAERAAVLDRVARVAASFDRRGIAGAAAAGAFASVMGPTEFKKQLWLSFDIKVTPAELGACMAHFDRDGSGTIEGAEFWIQFLRAGEERRVALREAAKRAAGARTAAMESFTLKQQERVMTAVSSAASVDGGDGERQPSAGGGTSVMEGDDASWSFLPPLASAAPVLGEGELERLNAAAGFDVGSVGDLGLDACLKATWVVLAGGGERASRP